MKRALKSPASELQEFPSCFGFVQPGVARRSVLAIKETDGVVCNSHGQKTGHARQLHLALAGADQHRIEVACEA